MSAKNETIGGYVSVMLKRTAKPYAEIAQAARKHFRGAQTTTASVRHYASKLRSEGVKLKDRPVVREAEYA